MPVTVERFGASDSVDVVAVGLAAGESAALSGEALGVPPFSAGVAVRAAIWRPFSLSRGTPVRTIAAVAGRKVASPTTAITMPRRRVQVPMASTHSNSPALVMVARSAPKACILALVARTILGPPPMTIGMR